MLLGFKTKPLHLQWLLFYFSSHVYPSALTCVFFHLDCRVWLFGPTLKSRRSFVAPLPLPGVEASLWESPLPSTHTLVIMGIWVCWPFWVGRPKCALPLSRVFHLRWSGKVPSSSEGDHLVHPKCTFLCVFTYHCSRHYFYNDYC